MVVVVSAMSKVTDLLLDTLRHAEAGDEAGMEANLEKLRERHVETCRELLPPDGQEAALDGHRGSDRGVPAHRPRHLMLGERPPRSVDEAVAIGERLSALLMAAYLETRGVAPWR